MIHSPKAIAIRVSIPDKNQKIKYGFSASSNTIIAANKFEEISLGARLIEMERSDTSAARQPSTLSTFAVINHLGIT